MVFQFEHPDRPIKDNVRRAARDELDRAIAEVGETGFELHGTVRNVRRRVKRVRSLLRLIRPVLRGFKAEDAALREIGAEIGALRDAMALVEAADALARGRDFVAAALEPLRRELAARAAAQESAVDREALLIGLRGRLRDARVRSELWEIDGPGRAALVPGFVATYRRARRGLEAARTTGRDEDFHDWRRALKHHAGQLSLLRGIVPAFAAGRLRQAKKLAGVLGDLQNLCVLRRTLEDDGAGLDPDDRAVVLSICSEGIGTLAQKSLKLGKPLLAEAPKIVEARWDAYWADWQAVRRF